MTLTSLEFYSGIGGMHYALKNVRPQAEVLAAFDINTTANDIYRFNFDTTRLCQNNIQAIDVDKLEGWNADLWTMSPPCQPFTKKGLQLGEKDRRTDSFLVLMDKLSVMKNPPRFMLIENVVGFEQSSVHHKAVEILKQKGYATEEFILNPLQLGHPNSRPRYYLLATLSSTKPSSPLSTTPPFTYFHQSTISSFIQPPQSIDHLWLDLKTIEKHRKSLDIVVPTSSRSACFTKSYNSYISGCGSYFSSSPLVLDGNHLDDTVDLNDFNNSIRRFSPREVANLMCFPEHFRQPPSTSDNQMFRTLGNSVNVLVVAQLLNYLLC